MFVYFADKCFALFLFGTSQEPSAYAVCIQVSFAVRCDSVLHRLLGDALDESASYPDRIFLIMFLFTDFYLSFIYVLFCIPSKNLSCVAYIRSFTSILYFAYTSCVIFSSDETSPPCATPFLLLRNVFNVSFRFVFGYV